MQSHYYYSNEHNRQLSFDEWYLQHANTLEPARARRSERPHSVIHISLSLEGFAFSSVFATHERRVCYDFQGPDADADAEAEYAATLGWPGRKAGTVAMRNFLALWLGYAETPEDEITVEALATRYDFVFVAERMEESYARFYAHMDIPGEADHAKPPTNRSPGPRGADQTDPRVLELFEQLNAKDLIIYKRANELLDQRTGAPALI